MTRHTPETVRAACERAGIPCVDVPWFVPLTHEPSSRTTGLWGIGNQQAVAEHDDGTLVHEGRYLTDRYPAEIRAETPTPEQARIAELEERVRVLRAALGFVEWRGGDWVTPGGCPCCGNDITEKHEWSCIVRAALATTEEK